MPDPWVAAWKQFYDGIWTDHVEHDRRPVPDDRPQSGWVPLLRRQGRDEHELPLVDLLPRGQDDGNRLEHGGDAGLQGQDDRRVQCRYLPDPQDEQEPRPGLRGAPVPAREQGSSRALRRDPRHRVTAGRASREGLRGLLAEAGLEGRQGRHQLRRCAELRVVHAGVQQDLRHHPQVRHEVADHPRSEP